MRIGFSVLLDDESHNFARELELELCKKFGLCAGLRQSPHITIKATFETDILKPFVKYLEMLSKEIKSFEIELSGFGNFKQDVIFIDVKENKHLSNLHLKILEQMKKEFGLNPDKFEGENVKFHSTIAYNDLTPTKFKDAMKYLQDFNPKFKFKIRYLCLFYNLGKDEGWIVSHKFKIKE
jgi:2'-5' RNA ligase